MFSVFAPVVGLFCAAGDLGNNSEDICDNCASWLKINVGVNYAIVCAGSLRRVRDGARIPSRGDSCGERVCSLRTRRSGSAPASNERSRCARWRSVETSVRSLALGAGAGDTCIDRGG